MTWWIWLVPINTKTTSLETRMLLPENRMFCGSNVTKQVNWLILSLSQCDKSWALHIFKGTAKTDTRLNVDHKETIQTIIQIVLVMRVLCHYFCPHLCNFKMIVIVMIEARKFALTHPFLGVFRQNLGNDVWCVSAVLKDLVLIPVHTKPEDSVKELDELYDVFQNVKKKWETDVILWFFLFVCFFWWCLPTKPASKYLSLWQISSITFQITWINHLQRVRLLKHDRKNKHTTKVQTVLVVWFKCHGKHHQ